MNKVKIKATESRTAERQTERDREAVRFLEWVQLHPGWWELICTPDDEHMTISTMKTLVEELVKEQFYEVLFALLTVHREKTCTEFAINSILLELVLSGWRGEIKGREQQLREIINLLT